MDLFYFLVQIFLLQYGVGRSFHVVELPLSFPTAGLYKYFLSSNLFCYVWVKPTPLHAHAVRRCTTLSLSTSSRGVVSTRWVGWLAIRLLLIYETCSLLKHSLWELIFVIWSIYDSKIKYLALFILSSIVIRLQLWGAVSEKEKYKTGILTRSW